MERLEKIATLDNQIEALCVRGELEERGIPFVMRSYYDLAYDGLFQFSGGWGHIEARAEHRDEILEIIEMLRHRSAERGDEEDEEDNMNRPETP
jgi:hypothetical protein